DGIDVVVSCVGASVSLSPTPGQGSYDDVDAAGNLNLLSEAERACVSKVVYVSAALAPGILDTAYVRAHERVVAALRQRGLPHAVVRPTGLFCALSGGPQNLDRPLRWEAVRFPKGVNHEEEASESLAGV